MAAIEKRYLLPLNPGATSRVDDPSNILGKAIEGLLKHAGRAVGPALAGSNPLRQPEPLPEPGQPVGIFTGKPMPLWTTPSPLGGLPSRSDASGNGNWLMPPKGVLDGKKSAIDGGAPAVPITPSDSPYLAGGLAGWLAALSGVDPRTTRPAPPPLDKGLRGYDRDDRCNCGCCKVGARGRSASA